MCRTVLSIQGWVQLELESPARYKEVTYRGIPGRHRAIGSLTIIPHKLHNPLYQSVSKCAVYGRKSTQQYKLFLSCLGCGQILILSKRERKVCDRQTDRQISQKYTFPLVKCIQRYKWNGSMIIMGLRSV